MALDTSVCFVKLELVNDGLEVVDEFDVALHVVRALDAIKTMIVERIERECGGFGDINTYMSDTIVVEILQIGSGGDVVDRPEDLQDTAEVQAEDDPLPSEYIDSDDVDCPVAIRELGEEVSVLAGLPAPHAAATDESVGVDPSPRRKRFFASAWRRIRRTALRLCCSCVR